MKTYHILNGDCLADQLKQTKINQDFIICRECLIDGDVNAQNLEEFWAMRSQFITDNYAISGNEYNLKTISEFNKITGIPKRAEVCLWFEDDLFCQTNLWFVITILANHSIQKIFRVFPLIEKDQSPWSGFGNSNVEQLEQAFQSKIQLTAADIELGKNLWSTYQKNDFAALIKLSKSSSKCFHYLNEVCQAHIDRFPSKDALGKPDQVVREIIEAHSDEFPLVFSAFKNRAGIYGFGDLQIKRIYERQMRNK